MRHQMHVEAKYREMIKNGTKRIEVRLYDAKRRKVQLGDEIEFLPMAAGEYDPRDKVIVRVTGILRYESFAALFQDFPMAMLAAEDYTVEALLKDLERLYTPGLQNTYGVVGFRFEI